MRPLTRREFLNTAGKGLGLVSFAAAAPRFLTGSLLAGEPSPERDRPVLVIVQLAGGNDGLNTLVPFEDDHYRRLRPTLGLGRDAGLVRLADNLAFHPACAPLANLWKEGALAIVRNVGYPNPNRSHFRSTEIWESADTDPHVGSGWMGRYFDAACDGEGRDPVGIHATGILPQTFFGERPHNTFGLDDGARPGGAFRKAGPRPRLDDAAGILGELADADHAPGEDDNAAYMRHALMDAMVAEDRVQKALSRDRAEADYPSSGLARSLKSIAALIASGLETRVYYASLGGFDTHANQLAAHARLLGELSGALAAFHADLTRRKIADRVTVMTFSEFGRRPSENATGGTDHGTAAPLFVMSPGVTRNLVGAPPSLDVEKNRDITHSTDFRQVYATLLRRRLGADPAKILGAAKFPELDFL